MFVLRYLARRIVNYAILLFIAVSLGYLVASAALDPRNAFDWTNPNLNKAAVNASLTQYNINPDTSIWLRYGRWLRMVFLHWNWGWTPRGEAINSLIATRIGVSVRLVTIGTILSLVGGVAVGAWSAVRQYHWSDRIVSFICMLLISTPTMVLAVVMQLGATRFNQATGTQFFQFIGETGQHPSYFGAGLIDRLQHLLLPTISLAALSMATYSRYQRNLMLDTLGADYVRTARAKGLRKSRAIRHHALRNAIIPMATYFAFGVAQVFVGATITEQVYGWNGMGLYSVTSIQQQDINGTVAVVAFSGVCVLAGALLSDILIAAIDPRVRAR
ncbi:MAG: ABC transporter permease [Acidipropionibacterium sp.]|jgi:peptide/nickel transport system permease protein|nr:ABC transporter permease [Acidipropionibacterium sp.]